MERWGQYLRTTFAVVILSSAFASEAAGQSSFYSSSDPVQRQREFEAGQAWVDSWEGVPEECLKSFASRYDALGVVGAEVSRGDLSRRVQTESGAIRLNIEAYSTILAAIGQQRAAYESQYINGELEWWEYVASVRRMNEGWDAGVKLIDQAWEDADVGEDCNLRAVP